MHISRLKVVIQLKKLYHPIHIFALHLISCIHPGSEFVDIGKNEQPFKSELLIM